MKSSICRLLSVAFLSSVLLTACSGGGSSNSSPDDLWDDKGTLSVSLTDAATDEYQAVYITVDEVEIYIPEECRS
jgi:hypothetical protein